MNNLDMKDVYRAGVEELKKANEVKEMLLALCRECASSGHDYHITNAHKDLRTWFNTVLVDNEKDLRKGMVEQRKKNLAVQAMKKLTPQEIQALGLKKE